MVRAEGVGSVGDRPPIVVVGGGLAGAATARALAARGEGSRVTLVEREHVGAAAGGKAGGFVARNWGNHATRRLHELGFELHEELAAELGVSSYRRIRTLSVQAGARGRRLDAAPEWLDRDVARVDVLDDDTAQVAPRELVEALVADATAKGATLMTGAEALGVRFDDSGNVATLRVTTGDGGEEVLDARGGLVLAMGPWAVRAAGWFDVPVPLTGIKSTSIVFDSSEDERFSREPRALFCGEDRNGCHMEVYPRASGEVYCCGLGGSDYVEGDRLLPGGDCDRPSRIEADPARVAAGTRTLAGMTSLGDAGPAVTQACMRPCAPDALPILGRVPTCSNAVLATGLNCWGVSWSLAVGVCVAELLLDGQCSSADIAAFDPARFFQRAGRRGRHRGAAPVGEQW